METKRTCETWQHGETRIRAVEPEDWEAFHRWDEDDETSRHAYLVPFPRSQAATRRWTEEAALRQPEGDVCRWVIANAAGDPVGTINTHTCDRRNGTFGYGVAVEEAHRRHGHAAAAIRLVLRYFFAELGYQKATVHVYAFNGASARLHERLGFQREGRLRRMILTAGEHADVLVYGITREEFFGAIGEG